MGKRKRGIKAWLVTWEHSGDHAKPPRRIAAIINARRSPERVREMVELLYINETGSPGERVLYVAGKHNPFPAEFGRIEGVEFLGYITCGHNPHLLARRVEDLHFVADGSAEEQVHWTDKTSENITIAREEIKRFRGQE